MFNNIPTFEPLELFKGDTLYFEITSDLYPASQGWTCIYNFNGPGKQTVSTTADGDAFLVNQSTSEWVPGDYWYQATVSLSGQTFTISTGRMLIKAALAGIAGYDGRSHAKRTLDAIEATIEGRAIRTDLEYTINGRMLRSMPHDDLVKFRTTYRKIYASEQNAERIKQGKSILTGNRYVVFKEAD